jgi:hypothetical protein
MVTETGYEYLPVQKFWQATYMTLLTFGIPRRAGLVVKDNCHLNYLAEFIFVNVGGSYRNAKASSLPMSDMSVEGVIVLGGRESLLHGEGHQGINTSRIIASLRNLRRAERQSVMKSNESDNTKE